MTKMIILSEDDYNAVLAQLNEIMEKQNTEPWLEHLREYRSNIPEKPAEKEALRRCMEALKRA